MGIFNFSKHIQELSEGIKAYISNQAEYYKLIAFRRAVKSVSVIIQTIVVGGLFLFFLSLISIGGALYIGHSLGQVSLGFLIIGGVYLVLFIIFLIFRKSLIETFVLREFSKIANEEEERIDEEIDPLTDEHADDEKHEE